MRRWAVSATPSTVAAIDLERGFEVVRSKAAGPTEGVFGAASPTKAPVGCPLSFIASANSGVSVCTDAPM